MNLVHLQDSGFRIQDSGTRGTRNQHRAAHSHSTAFHRCRRPRDWKAMDTLYLHGYFVWTPTTEERVKLLLESVTCYPVQQS